MTRIRVLAAIAAISTALVLQGALIGPFFGPVPVSLPAVLVAAVALRDGPGTGVAFGFATGLVADLASTHPAGVLALCWLGVGLVCGLVAGPAAGRRPIRRDAAVAALVCALASLGAALLLTVVHADGTGPVTGLVWVIPAGLGDALLALAVVPLTRVLLRSERLRPPAPSEPVRELAGRRG